MIEVVHEFDYWTDYLIGLQDDPRFKIVSLCRGGSNPRFSRGADTLILGQTSHSWKLDGRILLRAQHSPGFGLGAFRSFYNYAKKLTNCEFMLPHAVLEHCIKPEQKLSNQLSKFRDEILADDSVLTTKYDPMLNRTYRTRRKHHERFPNSFLFSLNWRVARNRKNLDFLSKVVKDLRQKCDATITFVGHPLMTRGFSAVGPIMYDAFVDFTKSCNATYYPSMSRFHLHSLMDLHEYIVTDGSGSVYEGIARGCKALRVYGFSYHKSDRTLSKYVVENMLPTLDVASFSDHKGIDHDLNWMRGFHGASLVDEDVSTKALDEIYERFS